MGTAAWRSGRSKAVRAFCWPHLLYSPSGALAYFELVGVATKHLSPTLVALSVALEPLCVSAIGIGFFGYALQPLEVGGYCCAALGAASLAAAYSCAAEPPRRHGALGGAPALRSWGAALAELWPSSTTRGRRHNEAGAQRALLSAEEDEACGVELEACGGARSPRAAYG